MGVGKIVKPGTKRAKRKLKAVVKRVREKPAKKARRVLRKLAKKKSRAISTGIALATIAEHAAKVFGSPVQVTSCPPTLADLCEQRREHDDGKPTAVFGTEGFDKSGHLVDPKLASAPIGTGLTEDDQRRIETVMANLRLEADREPPTETERMFDAERAADILQGWFANRPDRVDAFNAWTKGGKFIALNKVPIPGSVTFVEKMPVPKLARGRCYTAVMVILITIAAALAAWVIADSVNAWLGEASPVAWRSQ